jgi:hypothetical protein
MSIYRLQIKWDYRKNSLATGLKVLGAKTKRLTVRYQS